MESHCVRTILQKILYEGRASSPRDQDIIELDYFQGEIKNPWSMHPHRKYNLDYFKREFQWYLGANKYDTRICKHAKMWEKLIQPDKSILSNYGQYWWGPQGGYWWALRRLTEDPDSRQAYIAMNNYYHAWDGNADFVCTKGIQFRIIEDKLDMHVAMRSSDAIFGLGTDLPCFYFLWKMMAFDLKIPTGRFIFSADSVHIYERHFEMAANIVRYDHDNPKVEVPEITSTNDLISFRFKSEFGKWLRSAEL